MKKIYYLWLCLFLVLPLALWSNVPQPETKSHEKLEVPPEPVPSEDIPEKEEEKEKIPKITVKDRRLYVNGGLYYIKGICYGTFFPGKGFTKHAYMKFPEDLKRKDFELMKDAGFNTIRIYENMPDDFYDLALEYGFKVIEPVMWPGHYTNIENPDVLRDLKKEALKRVRKMKDHPSILMWAMWNDAPFHKTNIVEKFGIEKVNAFFKQIYDEIKKEDPHHPVTAANMINVEKGWSMGFSFLDVIGCNSYIGLDYNENAWKTSLFSRKEAKKKVRKMRDVSLSLNKPVFITETGSSTNLKPEKQGEVLAHQIAIVNEHLAGICIFELHDEWWKAGKNTTQEPELEEHWGLCDAYRNPKPAYEKVKQFMNGIPTESKGLNKELLKKIME